MAESNSNSISLRGYLQLFVHDKWSKHFAINSFPDSFDHNEFRAFMNHHGMRPIIIQTFINMHELFKKYTMLVEGRSEGVITLEDVFLREEMTNVDSSSITYYPLSNLYNFTALDLALMSDNIQLAGNLLDANSNFYKNYSSPVLQLFLMDIISDLSEKKVGLDFIAKYASIIDNPDAWISEDNAATITDSLLKDESTREIALNKTKDPLFALLKPNTNASEIFSDNNLAHIAISHGNGFWSTGIWEAARVAMKNHPDVQFHLVDYINFNNTVLNFDAWINPGAGDSYPRDKTFTLNDWQPTNEFEQLYQNALNSTLSHNMPYLGFCAGSQHFALHHGGAVEIVEGYEGVKHDVLLNKNTLLYFMTLNQAQQNQVLENCELPDVNFKGDTAHSFAARSDLLNFNEMRLAATYEDAAVAAGYEHINGIRFGTQFHPEHHYGQPEREENQHNILENFIKLAKKFQQAKLGKAEYPHLTQPQIQERLEECIVQEAYYIAHPDNALCFVNSTIIDYCVV